jgi:hypothetical protein
VSLAACQEHHAGSSLHQRKARLSSRGFMASAIRVPVGAAEDFPAPSRR